MKKVKRNKTGIWKKKKRKEILRAQKGVCNMCKRKRNRSRMDAQIHHRSYRTPYRRWKLERRKPTSSLSRLPREKDRGREYQIWSKKNGCGASVIKES